MKTLYVALSSTITKNGILYSVVINVKEDALRALNTALTEKIPNEQCRSDPYFFCASVN